MPASKRRRRHGASDPGVMKCPEIGAEFFSWFAASDCNIHGPVPSSWLFHVAMVSTTHLLHFPDEHKDLGLVARHVELALPVLDHGWLRRWPQIASPDLANSESSFELRERLREGLAFQFVEELRACVLLAHQTRPARSFAFSGQK